ncbi:MAG: DUF2956 domain-containing protein [Shewanella sp.]|nr:DUF2956 domain-containing protein [Shewanella sp.]MCF1432126.1 DUF2956 domain-containing protein [Shewanella sp.]MCF1439203.1 DUF2956 domain-containing protein [Shewanella sp.]MCF1457818.1 DUF2956 domain-containing protein [Shewanella sp.]
MKTNISEETRQDAMKIARATQKPGQTKEQTRLIAQGIEKGIAEYKKQQKAKSRERDKARKQQLRAKAQLSAGDEAEQEISTAPSRLPWLLLALSWAGFIGLYLLKH